LDDDDPRQDPRLRAAPRQRRLEQRARAGRSARRAQGRPGDLTMLAALQDYLPLDDLVKIVGVCLVVAVVAPSAVSLPIAGLDRRARHAGDMTATAFVVVGVGAIEALIGAGLCALFTD